MTEITQNLLNDIFYYRDGHLYWKAGGTPRGKQDDIAGSINAKGYRYVEISGRKYRASRLIFLLLKGVEPDIVDHINGIRSDDRIENLRPATRVENARNRAANSSSTSKYVGVSYKTSHRKYVAQIGSGADKKHLGLFDTEIDAYNAYISAAKDRYNGFYRKPEDKVIEVEE